MVSGDVGQKAADLSQRSPAAVTCLSRPVVAASAWDRDSSRNWTDRSRRSSQRLSATGLSEQSPELVTFAVGSRLLEKMQNREREARIIE